MKKLIKHQYHIHKVCIGVFCICIGMTAQAADSNVCSTASSINPNTLDSGMGGTGIVAKSGLGGTGITNENGLGGTGITAAGIAADGGMGGTGINAGQGGFGGTGDAISLLPQDALGGVAIIGVVTGFASICVNGEEVFYDKSTLVYDNGMAAKLSSLATGKMIMLKADKVNGQLRARSMGLFDAVAGPIEHVDTKLNQMQVMGQIVRLNQNTAQQIKGLSPNANVRVSGHRLDSGEIVATRVDVNNAASASTLGLVTSVTGNSMLVNGTRVTVTNKSMLTNIKVGSEIRVNGVWDGGTMHANQLESQPITNSINRADSAIIEGFVKLGHENKMRLDGTEIQASQGNASYSSVEKSHGKVVKLTMHRDNKGYWVCDKLEQRSGKLFEQHGLFKGDSDSNNSSEPSSGSDNNGNMNSGSGNIESDSNSGSGSSLDSGSGRGHDSSSDSSRSGGGRSQSGSGGSERGSSGSGIDRSSGGYDSGRDSPRGSGNGSGSGKNK